MIARLTYVLIQIIHKYVFFTNLKLWMGGDTIKHILL